MNLKNGERQVRKHMGVVLAKFSATHMPVEFGVRAMSIREKARAFGMYLVAD